MSLNMFLRLAGLFACAGKKRATSTINICIYLRSLSKFAKFAA